LREWDWPANNTGLHSLDHFSQRPGASDRTCAIINVSPCMTAWIIDNLVAPLGSSEGRLHHILTNPSKSMKPLPAITWFLLRRIKVLDKLSNLMSARSSARRPSGTRKDLQVSFAMICLPLLPVQAPPTPLLKPRTLWPSRVRLLTDKCTH
jgi:hypothetical protein